MNIGMIVASLRIGGLERMVCELSAGLESAGHRVSVFCTDEPGILFEGIRAHARECGGRRAIPLLPDFRLVKRLRTFVRDQGIELLHAHNHVAHRYAVMAASFDGVPVVCTCHGQGYGDRARTWRTRRVLAGRTRFLVAVSEDVGRILERQGVPPAKIRVIRNGVGPPPGAGEGEKRVLRERLDVPPDALVFGSVGRLMPEKNYALLIRAFAACAGCGEPPAGKGAPALLLVGDGPCRGELEGLAAELGIQGRTIFSGMQSDVWPWLRCMDVFCLSSHTEGTSLTLLEAALCGLPLVATDVGGNREILGKGLAGILVRPGDTRGLTLAMSDLTADSNRRVEMGRRAREHVLARYSADAMICGYLDIYRKALDKVTLT